VRSRESRTRAGDQVFSPEADPEGAAPRVM
jgi:hypothetical protein